MPLFVETTDSKNEEVHINLEAIDCIKKKGTMYEVFLKSGQVIEIGKNIAERLVKKLNSMKL